MVLFLSEIERYLWGVHILGVVFGLGAATVTDLLFVDFMRDFRIRRREAALMELLSKLVWAGILLLIVSGVGLVLPRWEAFVASDRFMMKMTAVLVVVANGVLLNLWIQPRARRISFVKRGHEKGLSQEELDKRVRLRRGAFALGGVSFVAWYGAFALAVLDMVTMSYVYLLAIFVGGLVVAVGASQVKERQYRKTVEEETAAKVLES